MRCRMNFLCSLSSPLYTYVCIFDYVAVELFDLMPSLPMSHLLLISPARSLITKTSHGRSLPSCDHIPDRSFLNVLSAGTLCIMFYA